ncbi:hypothetical protein C8R44DRAFT_728928 [Mycena epipterygia]|nr:hypothetical protein C8R44DRAFT_728928 [Mycena epipterygia]
MSLHARFELSGNLKDIDEAIDLHREALTLQTSLYSLNHLKTAAKIEFKQQGVIDELELDSNACVLLLPVTLSTVKGTSLASDACMCAVGLGAYTTAVEFLEASRSVFWSQALHLRTPLDELATIRPDLCSKFAELSRELEEASFRDASRNALASADHHKVLTIEAEWARAQGLKEQWDETIKSICISVPRFEDFMKLKLW